MPEEAGEVVACPACGRDVKQKVMIPVLAEGGGRRYLCRDCARALIPADATPGEAEAAEPGSSDGTPL